MSKRAITPKGTGPESVRPAVESQPACKDTDAQERGMHAGVPCCACRGGRTKRRSPEEFRTLVNRLSRIEGQVRGIRRMVEEDAYCVDIVTQVSAVGAALNAFNRELLGAHIKTCVADGVRGGNDVVIDELVSTLQRLMR